jgi:diguanylate cyclase (GGDEF)-like protein
MPGLSGIDVCRLLRGRKDAPYVYVLLCTSRDGHRQLIDGLAAGADDYVRKPIDTQELEVRLRAGRRVVLLQDELLEAKAELERRALYDSLTGAKNRGAILDVAKRELSRSKRSGKPFAVAIADVDHFKRVNDTYGHPAGDAVLREFVKRTGNVVRAHDDLGRYGGEEFLFVLPECPTEGALNAAERLRIAVAEEGWYVGGTQISITASFGIAGTDQGYEEIDTLINAADEALYTAKNAGRNRAMLAAGRGVLPAVTLRGS